MSGSSNARPGLAEDGIENLEKRVRGTELQGLFAADFAATQQAPRPSRGLYGTRLRMRKRMPLTVLILAVGCGGGASYNYARTYEPLSAEKAHLARSETPVSLEQVKRDPNGYKGDELGWFGVVTGMGDLSDGKTRLSLSLRAHQERHLCGDERGSSCRVTVSEKDLGPFTVDVALSPEEKLGQDRVWFGSLLRVYGHPTGEYDAEGGPLLDVTYFRHFPRGTYVTTASRGGMRR
jgi:hypothetical protein